MLSTLETLRGGRFIAQREYAKRLWIQSSPSNALTVSAECRKMLVNWKFLKASSGLHTTEPREFSRFWIPKIDRRKEAVSPNAGLWRTAWILSDPDR